MLADCVAYARERENLMVAIRGAGKLLSGVGESGKVVDCEELLRRCLFGDCMDEMIGFLAVLMGKRI